MLLQTENDRRKLTPLDRIYRLWLWIASPETFYSLVEYYVGFGVISGIFEVDSQAVFAHLRQTPSTPNAARPLDVRPTPLREAAAKLQPWDKAIITISSTLS